MVKHVSSCSFRLVFFYTSPRLDFSEVSDTSKKRYISVILHTCTSPGFLIFSPVAREVGSLTAAARLACDLMPGKACTDRSGKLYRARSRLYRSQILQVNMRLKALAEIYTMPSFAHLATFAKFCWIFTKFADFSNRFFAEIWRLQRCRSVQIL